MFSINAHHYRELPDDLNDKTNGRIACLGTFEAHSGPIASVRPSQDGARVLTLSSLNEGVAEWDVIKGSRMRTIELTFQV